MRGFQKWLSVGFFTFMVVVLGAGWVVVQQAPEAQVLPGAQTKSLLPPKLFPSSPQPDEKTILTAPLAQRQKLTLQGVVEKIRALPNGLQKLEEARLRGAPLPLSSSFSPSFSLTLEPGSKWYSSYSGGSGMAHFYGEWEHGETAGECLPYRNYSSSFGTQIIQPAVMIAFTVPFDDWYTINIEATQTKASLKHYDGGSYSTVETIDQSSERSSDQSYPAVVELAAGRHYFYWVCETAGAEVYVYEVNVYSLH